MLQSAKHSLYHAGDTAYFTGFREIGERLSPGVALLPIGGLPEDSVSWVAGMRSPVADHPPAGCRSGSFGAQNTIERACERRWRRNSPGIPSLDWPALPRNLAASVIRRVGSVRRPASV